MAADKEFTIKEVESHSTKKDLYMIVHDKVYDVSAFVDEHPYVLSFLSPTLSLSSRLRRSSVCDCSVEL